MAATIRFEGLPPELLQGEAEALARLLDGQPGLSVERPADGPIAPGERGGLLEIGTLLLSHVTAQGIEALTGALRVFFEARDSEITLTLKGEGGQEAHLTARNFDPDRLAETVAALRPVLQPTPPDPPPAPP